MGAGSTRRRAAATVVLTLVSATLQALATPLAAPASAATGSTYLVTRGTPPSSQPSLSPDGRYVAYTSSAALVPEDTNPGSDVYLSQSTGTPAYSNRPVLVSVGAAGAANGDSSAPAVSGDGHFVVFSSAATNLVDGDTNGKTDLFLRDLFTLTTTRIAQDAAQPAISTNGRKVAYASGGDVFLLDRDSGTVTNVTASLDAPASDPAISGNGSYVAFTTTSSGGTQGWRWSAADGPKALGTGQAGDHIGQVSLSDDGVVAYVSSQATHQGYAGDGLPAGPKVFVEWPGGNWEWVSDGLSATPSDPRISGDGASVAFVADGAVRLARTEARYGATTSGSDGQAAPVVGPANGSQPAVSATGRTVAMTTTSQVGSDTDTAADVVVADTGATLDQVLHPRLDSIDGISAPDPLAHIDPADIPTDAFYGVDPGLAGAGRSSIGRSSIGRSSIGRSSIGRSSIGRSSIGRSSIGRSSIGRSSIGRSSIGRSSIGLLPLTRFPLLRPDGGWTTLLQGTPFQELPLQSVTLKQAYDWATANATDPKGAAILGIDIADFAPGSAFSTLNLAGFLLAETPVSQLRLPSATASTNLGAWQDAVAAQGFPRTLVDSSTIVLQLLDAGVDLSGTTIGLLPLSEVPLDTTSLPYVGVVALDLNTPLGLLRTSDLAHPASVLDCTGGCPAGTLRDNAAKILPNATLADLTPGLPVWATFEELVRSLTLPEAFDWEDLNWNALGPGRYANPQHSQLGLAYRAGFDTGVGGAAFVKDAQLDVQLPPGTSFVDASIAAVGPREFEAPYKFQPGGHDNGFEDRGTHVLFQLGDVPTGTTLTVSVTVSDTVDYDQSGPLTATLSSSTGFDDATLTLTKPADYQQLLDPPANDTAANAPLLDKANRIYFGDITRTDDVDYYRIPRPAYGKRLVVALGAVGGDADLGVFQATGDDAPPANGGTASGDYIGSTPLLDQGRRGRLQPAPLNILDESGYTLLDGSTHTGTDSEQVEVPGTLDGGGSLLIKVASAGRASTLPYTLRYLYVDEPTEQKCPSYQPKNSLTLDLSTLPTLVPTDTNTVFLVDPSRMTQDYGILDGLNIQAGTAIVNALNLLNGQAGVKSVVIPITGIDVLGTHKVAAVKAARARLDANPCSVSAANGLARSISDELATFHLPSLKNVVFVGGDDVIPMYRQPQGTFDVVESWNEPVLRLATGRTGSCATSLGAPWDAMPCDRFATPESAAAHSDMILTDDPYGDATPIKVLDRTLSVPNVALGRLGETPTEIRTAVNTFIQSGGVMKADTSLLTGYDAWNELPDAITAALGARIQGRNTELTGQWTRQQMLDALFPAGASPNIVSLNAHASETDLLPGVPGASPDIYSSSDLVHAGDLKAKVDRLKAALLFTIGCHAGGELPDTWYGPGALDWAQALGGSGGYIANTGFGIADTAATAMSERLAALYARALTRASTAGEALTMAKHDYLAGLGQYLGYDEKVLMQTTYYGLPMYKIQPVAGATPAPSVKRATTWSAPGTDSGLSERTTTITPGFESHVAADGSGYLTSGEDPQTDPGLPILSKMTLGIDPISGQSPKGALITGMSSSFGGPTKLAVADSSYGDRAGPGRYDDIAFPASLAHVTTEQSLVLLTDRVDADSTGTSTDGRTEKITRADVMTYFSGTSDRTPPSLHTTTTRSGGNVTFTVVATDNGPSGSTRRGLVLVQPDGQSAWTPYEMSRVSGDTWRVTIPDPGVFRAFTQVVDQNGLVGIDMNRGHFLKGSSVAPKFTAPADLTLPEGSRWFGQFAITDPDSTRFTGRVDFGFGPQEFTVEDGPDGVQRGLLELFAANPGVTPVSVEVCDDSGLCTDATFTLTVKPANHAPQASVSLSSTLPRLGDTLTATGASTDADGDPVTLAYRWWIDDQLVRNADGTPYDGTTFLLDSRVHMGDTVTVTVTPNDGFTDGGGSSASAVVRVTSGPAVDGGPDAVVDEGSAWKQTGTWNDPESDAIQTATVDYGDGSGVQPLTVNADGTFTLAHTYADNGSYTVKVAMTDVTGQSGTDTTGVTVRNVPPTITSVGTSATILNGASYSLNAAWTDPGVLDTHTMSVAWGDGTTSAGTVDQAANTGTATHTYPTAGTYTVAVTITDKDGGKDTRSTYATVTVYFNTAGSMSANGHYVSPVGAWSVMPNSSAQANYGGNVKSTGATPTGKVFLTYDLNPLDHGCDPATCIEMDSTALTSFGEKKVTQGTLAVVRGPAIVDNQAGYTFLWVALDGSPDRVRIKVTDSQGNVVYDTQRGDPEDTVPTAVDTDGSVVIK